MAHPSPPQPVKDELGCAYADVGYPIQTVLSAGVQNSDIVVPPTCRALAHACQRKAGAHIVAVQQAFFRSTGRFDGRNGRLGVVAQACLIVSETDALLVCGVGRLRERGALVRSRSTGSRGLRTEDRQPGMTDLLAPQGWAYLCVTQDWRSTVHDEHDKQCG